MVISNRIHHLRETGGELALVSTYRDRQNGVTGLEGAEAADVPADGQHLYASAGANVVVFRRDALSGGLTFASVFTAPSDSPSPEPHTVTIDGGAEYTADRSVVVTVRGGYGSFVFSNDGGFEDARGPKYGQDGNYRWTLASTGPERLAKTVYVRDSSFGGTARDEIVLDESLPVVSSVRRVERSPVRSLVRVRAADRISGVRAVQVTRNRRRSTPWRRYSRRAAYKAPRGRAWVRVRDRAGNRSRWRRVNRARPR